MIFLTRAVTQEQNIPELSSDAGNGLFMIALYEQVELLKKHSKAIVLGLISGVITSLVCVLVLALLFHFDHAQYVTLLPKSITTAIGMGISEELGGYVTIGCCGLLLPVVGQYAGGDGLPYI